VSLFLAALAMAGIPWTAPSLVPWLFVVKCTSAFVVNIPISHPLCADYLDKSSIARGAAVNSLGAIVGEVLSMGVLFRITADMSEKEAFGVAAGVSVVTCLIIFFMVTDRKAKDTPE
jgi:hypothetical protein